eukprot:316834-Pelagomonas_calceolata.AAC.3
MWQGPYVYEMMWQKGEATQEGPYVSGMHGGAGSYQDQCLERTNISVSLLEHGFLPNSNLILLGPSMLIVPAEDTPYYPRSCASSAMPTLQIFGHD